MTLYKLFELAEQAGWDGWSSLKLLHPAEVARIERFGFLVAAAEREECAKILMSMRSRDDQS